MKGTLEFDLRDPDERVYFELAYSSQNMQMCFFDIMELFRKEFKDTEHGQEVSDYIDKIREKLYEIIKSRNLSHLIM